MEHEYFSKAAEALKRGQHDEALRLYTLCAETNPANEAALLQLAEICFAKGELASADAWMSKAFALNPCQKNLESFGIAKVKLIEAKERSTRAHHNLPTDHMLDVTQDPFQYTRDEIAALDALVSTSLKELKPTAAYVSLLATAKFLTGEYDVAEKAYRMLASVNSELPYADLRFSESFYRELEDADDDFLFGYLPNVRDVKPFESPADNVFLLPSDIKYFKEFSTPLAQSIWDFAPDTAIHFHVVTNTQADDDALNNLGGTFKKANVRITSEPLPSLASTQSQNGVRCYYHAVRLIRFHQFLRAGPQTLWMLDVDALANQDPTQMFTLFADRDIGIKSRPGRLEPWHQFSACLLTARPTPAALLYTRLVAAYLSHFLSSDGLSWGTDQVALYSVYRYMLQQNQPPQIHSWGPEIADVGEYRADSAIWFTAGANKFRLNANPNDAPIFEPEARYIEKYRRYRDSKT